MHEEIVFYGTKWCFDCKKSRRFLDKMKVEYRFVDIDRDSDGRTFVQEVNNGNRSVPTIVFPDGEILVEPSSAELAGKLGSGMKE
jgi:glutaredoxin-like protein